MPSVLIVDDNTSVLQSLELFFQYEGYTVHLAADGATGLRLAAEKGPDIVMLDVEMPQMSGVAVCKALKENPALSRLPVVMMTGRPLRGLVEQSRAAGADEVLGKPFELASLRKLFSDLIASRSALPVVPKI